MKIVRLGDIATYINGYAFKPGDWGDEGRQIIRIQDLTGNGYQANRFAGSVPEKYNVIKGDVLISWSASLGVYVWNGEEAVLNQHIFKVVFDKEIVNKEFFIHQVSGILKKAASEAHGATMKHLTKPVFDALPFALPDIEEQNKIAEILDKSQSVINTRKQQLSEFDTLIKARFVEMFGDPVSNPKGWPRVQLWECLKNIENGKSFICSNYSRCEEKPAILKLSAATYGEYRPNENKALLDEELFIDSAEVHKGDLLFTRKNTPELVGMAAYVHTTPPRLMMPDLIFRLNTKDNCSKIFLWQLINHELFRNKIRNLATGSAKSMSNISKERLLKLAIYLPPMKLQEQFTDFVAQVDKSKVVVQQMLNESQKLFDSLMQEYFG